jgi:hypothetical protein
MTTYWANLWWPHLHEAGIQTFQFEGHRTILPNDIFEIKVHEDDVDDALAIIESKELE